MSEEQQTFVVAATRGPGKNAMIIVRTEAAAKEVVTFLVDRSAWFELTPLPDDQWRINHKEENHAALLGAFGVPIRNTLEGLLEDPWEVTPFLTPQVDDDPLGVYQIEPVRMRLTEQYEATDPEDDPDFARVHEANVAVAELLQKLPALHGLLTEFVADVEAVGPEQVGSEWPDLSVTYRKAKRVLETKKGQDHE